MKALLILCMLAIGFQSFGQDLHIYYDVHKDTIWYVKAGKTVTNLEVKKDQQVFFHLVEFNNYLYKATFDVVQTNNSAMTSGLDSSGVQGMMPSFMSNLMGSPVGMPFLNIPVFGSLLSTLSGISGGQARGGLEEIDMTKEKLKQLEIDKVLINNMIADINSRRKAMALLQSDFSFINNLCMSESILPSTLKEMMLLYFKDVFMLKDGEKFGLKKIDSLNNILLETPMQESALQESIKSYQENYGVLAKDINRLKMSDHGIDELYPLIKQFEVNSKGIMKSLNQYVTENNDSTELLAPAEVVDFTPRIKTFYLKYEEVLNNNFTYTHSVKIEEKYLFYTLNLYKKTTLNQSVGREAQPDKTVEVKVMSYGTTRLFTSIGLCGAKFQTNPEKYFIRNDVLEAEAVDPYIPLISTFIHLGFDTRGPIMPAISVGLGIPISGNDVVDNFSFLVGPSLFIGKMRQFVISGGIMYTKVQRLAKSFEVGDEIQIGEGEIPTIKKYGLGYFVGVSYNLGGG